MEMRATTALLGAYTGFNAIEATAICFLGHDLSSADAATLSQLRRSIQRIREDLDIVLTDHRLDTLIVTLPDTVPDCPLAVARVLLENAHAAFPFTSFFLRDAIEAAQRTQLPTQLNSLIQSHE
jgi:predicted ABC-type transport system involved in lysophospholipase L1 biosynthesis ATPase subunit